jgi:transposase
MIAKLNQRNSQKIIKQIFYKLLFSSRKLRAILAVCGRALSCIRIKLRPIRRRMDIMENNIEVLPHPAMSPDLNPIEHLWDMMGRRLRDLERQPINLQELGAALQQIWHEIPQATIRPCINMHNRLQEVIRRRGGNTPY